MKKILTLLSVVAILLVLSGCATTGTCTVEPGVDGEAETRMNIGYSFLWSD